MRDVILRGPLQQLHAVVRSNVRSVVWRPLWRQCLRRWMQRLRIGLDGNELLSRDASCTGLECAGTAAGACGEVI